MRHGQQFSLPSSSDSLAAYNEKQTSSFKEAAIYIYVPTAHSIHIYIYVQHTCIRLLQRGEKFFAEDKDMTGGTREQSKKERTI